MHNINEAFEDEEFNLLIEIKEKHNYKSWRKFIIDAANVLNTNEKKGIGDET